MAGDDARGGGDYPGPLKWFDSEAEGRADASHLPRSSEPPPPAAGGRRGRRAGGEEDSETIVEEGEAGKQEAF